MIRRVTALVVSAALLVGGMVFTTESADAEVRGSAVASGPAVLPSPGTYRYAGIDRYETAAAISRATYPAGASAVVIATGTDFPDALAAAPLAAKLAAPLLLTQPGGLPQSTADELTRLSPERVIIVGGTGAISRATADALRTRTGVNPERLAGVDRYATAQRIAEYGWQDGFTDLMVATGKDYPDALSASPVASRLGGPLVLVPAADGDQLRPARAVLEKSRAAVVHVVGGTGAVPTRVADAIVKGLPASITRYAGGDRFQTSSLLLEAHFPTGSPAVFWANGMNFPDAVAGSAAAGASGAALALTRPQCVPGAVLDQTRRMAPAVVIALGGASAVSDNARAGLQCFDKAVVPAVSGSTNVGSTLSVTTGSWSPAATSFSYRWLRNGSEIPGATAATYRLVPADGNRNVSVRVTAHRDGFAATSVTSAQRRIIDLALLGNPHSPQMVVNKKRPLSPTTHVPTGLYYPNIPNLNRQPVKWEAGQHLEAMSAAAKQAGYSLFLVSGYRSYATQQSLYNSYVRRDGRARADLYSARPGHSEHQTGFAVDLYAYGYCQGECFGTTAPGQWLRNNAHRFGFILRYDQGMTHITGYAYEPWHFRYVGVEIATEMRNKGIRTLEQYYGLPAAPNY